MKTRICVCLQGHDKSGEKLKSKQPPASVQASKSPDRQTASGGEITIGLTEREKSFMSQTAATAAPLQVRAKDSFT